MSRVSLECETYGTVPLRWHSWTADSDHVVAVDNVVVADVVAGGRLNCPMRWRVGYLNCHNYRLDNLRAYSGQIH